MLDIFNFKEHVIPMEKWVAGAVDWLVGNYRPQFQAVKWPVEQTLNGIDWVLQAVPPIIFLIVLFAIAWRLSSWKVGIFGVVTFLLAGYLGMWEETMTTLAMVISAVVFCVIAGIPLGIIAARSDRFVAFIRPILDAMQTTPAFVYLVPVVMLFSIGTVAGVIATIVFACRPSSGSRTWASGRCSPTWWRRPSPSAPRPTRSSGKSSFRWRCPPSWPG